MGFFGFFLFGFIVGVIVKFIFFGKQGGGWLIIFFFGVVGVLLGGWLGSVLFNVLLEEFFFLQIWFFVIGGLFIVFFIYGFIVGCKVKF